MGHRATKGRTGFALDDCTISINSTILGGSNVKLAGTMTVSASTISGIYATKGTIFHGGTLTIGNNRITGNTASEFGGSIANWVL
jgi:hypothetical protein